MLFCPDTSRWTHINICIPNYKGKLFNEEFAVWEAKCLKCCILAALYDFPSLSNLCEYLNSSIIKITADSETKKCIFLLTCVDFSSSLCSTSWSSRGLFSTTVHHSKSQICLLIRRYVFWCRTSVRVCVAPSSSVCWTVFTLARSTVTCPSCRSWGTSSRSWWAPRGNTWIPPELWKSSRMRSNRVNPSR